MCVDPVVGCFSRQNGWMSNSDVLQIHSLAQTHKRTHAHTHIRHIAIIIIIIIIINHIYIALSVVLKFALHIALSKLCKQIFINSYKG